MYSRTQHPLTRIDPLHAVLAHGEPRIRVLKHAHVQYRGIELAHLVHVERDVAGGDGARVGWLAAALGVEDCGGCGEDVWRGGGWGFEEGLGFWGEGGEGVQRGYGAGVGVEVAGFLVEGDCVLGEGGGHFWWLCVCLKQTWGMDWCGCVGAWIAMFY